jgi:hypothetical protein
MEVGKVRGLTVKELRDALTKLIETKPETANMLAVTSDAECEEYFTLPENPTFTCGNYTRYDNGENLFLTEEDFAANDPDDEIKYVENAICLDY